MRTRESIMEIMEPMQMTSAISTNRSFEPEASDRAAPSSSGVAEGKATNLPVGRQGEDIKGATGRREWPRRSVGQALRQPNSETNRADSGQQTVLWREIAEQGERRSCSGRAGRKWPERGESRIVVSPAPILTLLVSQEMIEAQVKTARASGCVQRQKHGAGGEHGACRRTSGCRRRPAARRCRQPAQSATGRRPPRPAARPVSAAISGARTAHSVRLTRPGRARPRRCRGPG